MSLPRRFLQWALLLLTLFAVIFLRAPDTLLHPALQVEDGAYVFPYFYQHRGLEQIFHRTDRYVHLTSNLIGYCSARLPTRLIPYGLTWFPLFLALAAYSVFFSTRYRPCLPSDQGRAVTCVLFALAPISSFHHLSHTDYSHWNALLLLILLSIRPLPRRSWRRYSYWASCNVLVWGSPLSLLVLPLTIYFLVVRTKHRLLQTILIVNLVAHHFLGVEAAQVFSGLDILGRARETGRAFGYTVVIAARAAFRTAVGSPLLAWAERHMWFLILFWAVLIVAATSLIVWTRPRSRAPVLVLFYFICGVTFLEVVGRSYGLISAIDDSPRYVYIQSLAFLALFVTFATGITRRVRRRLPGASTSALADSKWRRTETLILAAIVGHYFLLNMQLGYYVPLNSTAGGPYNYADRENGRIVHEYFKRLAAMEDRAGARAGICLAAEKKRDWAISIDTRAVQTKPTPGETGAALGGCQVPEHWRETSVWLRARLAPGARFALQSNSDFTRFDSPFRDTDERWVYTFRTDAPRMLDQMKEANIRTVLIDVQDLDFESYRGKLSSEQDVHGPLRFLGWPRCFADHGNPSRFLGYCAP